MGVQTAENIILFPIYCCYRFLVESTCKKKKEEVPIHLNY